MSRSRFPRWSDLRPLSPAAAQREQAAVRLALLLAVGMLRNGHLLPPYRSIPGDEEDQFDWLRAALRPLDRRSPTVALVRRLLHLNGSDAAWFDERALRRHLHRLAAEAQRVGTPVRPKRHG